MYEIREYVDAESSPFDLGSTADAGAAIRVRTALARMEAGNLSNVRGVGSGVLEYRVHVGPGWVYSGRDGDTLIVLLRGTKVRQQDYPRCPQALARDGKRRGMKHGAHP